MISIDFFVLLHRTTNKKLLTVIISGGSGIHAEAVFELHNNNLK